MPFFHVANIENTQKYLIEASNLDDLKRQGMMTGK